MATRAEVVVLDTPEAVAREGARILADTALEFRARNHGGFVALSGGSTPKAMYHELCQLGEEEADALRRMRYFFGDERSVGNHHADSNVRLAMGGFILPVRVPYSHVYTPNGGARPLEQEAARLTQLLADELPRSHDRLPVFDLVFLGLGTDGHTASLFPGTAGLHSTVPGFVANEVPQLDTWRLTLTYPVLSAAEHVVFLVTGANKADVLAEIMDPASPPDRYPSMGVAARRVTWLVDREAGAALHR